METQQLSQGESFHRGTFGRFAMSHDLGAFARALAMPQDASAETRLVALGILERFAQNAMKNKLPGGDEK